MAIRQDSSTAIVAGLAGAAAGVAIACGLRGPISSGKPVVVPIRQPLDAKYSKALEDARKEFGEGKWEPQDGATASAWVAYQCVDNIMVFPITPSTLMAEMADTWATSKVTNGFDQVPAVAQLQSEAGAAGAVHGCLAVGGLATTFTASQGLLLMLPNMLKIAGELTPCVFHVPARAVAGQALSIFGDQNDLCQVRSTGFSILFGSTVQETLDFALAAHIATLRSRVPFVNAFDGFRTSHELQKIQVFPKAVYKRVVQLLQPEIDAHRQRGLNPNHPHVRGTAQCEDIYFQAVEKSNTYYLKVPAYVEEAFQWVETLCGRKYDLFEYVGSKRAKYVVVIMGSGSGAVEEYLDHTKNSDYGLVKVRLFRPWSLKHFLAALPLATLKGVAVCNKMKEAAAMGEPLFMDVCTSLQQGGCTASVLNGRFGLSSKDLTPGMVEAVFNNLKAPEPKNPFTIGIEDDITFYSLPYKVISTVPEGTTQCIFWGFGSDGTVGANKNTIKIIAQNTPLYAQGYFQYDALKSGGVTISYLRFGPQPIKASYLIDSGCGYLAMHKKEYIFSMKARIILGPCKDESTLVLNVPWTDEELDAKLPGPFKKIIGQKRLKVFAIDANAVAKLSGMGRLINNIMTAVFFQLSKVLPVEQAVGLLKDAVKKTYKSKGDAVVGRNITAVDAALSGLRTVNYDAGAWSSLADDETCYEKLRAEEAPAYVTEVLDKIQLREGGELKVSQLEVDGCVDLGQTQWAKRGVAECIPVVDNDKCIQCNVCSAICPHAVIRPFVVTAKELESAPGSFETVKATGGNLYAGLHFRIQASPLDCTGCEVCTHACPTSALTMKPLKESLDLGHEKNWNFAMSVPNRGDRFDPFSLKGSQFQVPMMEFSGACEGCGETPYAKLLTQLIGQRLIIANATGCSSIWGGTAGWVPYTKDKKTGKGVAWGNSLFEDNAEYGFGQFSAVQQRRLQLKDRVDDLLTRAGESLSPSLRGLLEQWLEFFNDKVVAEKLAEEVVPLLENEKRLVPEVAEVLRLKDLFVKPSMWMMGGDGWANDIGYGGIDHVLASGKDVKILVMDTEVYSNTGGQSSKATPMGAVAKFAQGGRQTNKKDLGALAMAYRHIYVASCAMGANYKQCVQAITEAEQYNGPALVMCYSPCIEHRTKTGMSQMSLDQKDAVECGYWPLYRFSPVKAALGENPFQLDSKKITGDVMKFLIKQNRYAQLARASPELADELHQKLQKHLSERHAAMRAKADEQTPAAAAALKQGLAGAAGEQLLILFGSDTGVTEGLAKKFAGLCLERGIRVKRTIDLDEVSEVDELKDAATGATTVIMCATCGHGDFPQNASLFWSSLSSPDVSPGTLGGMKFCVFGMGDKSYTHTFCEAAKLIEKRMEELGANKILGMGIGDDRDEDKWETGFNKWLPDFWAAIKAPAPVDDGAPKKPLFELAFHDTKLMPAKICPPGAQLLEIQENTRLTPADYERDIRHFSVSTKGVDLPFDLGDAVAVYYENLPNEVDEALTHFALDGGAVMTVKCTSDNVSDRHRKAFQRRTTVRQVFAELLDLFGRPTKSFCADLARFATSKDERATLQKLALGGDVWKALADESATFFDICKKFPSAKPPLDQLMSIVTLTKPRLYSIASSPFYAPDKLDLTIVINQWKTKSGQLKTGACTRFIQKVGVGAKIAAAAVVGTFKFPESDATPMVMVGLGTGIAPIRSFMQDKLYKKNKGIKTGPMVVFYGCRREKEELFYKDEWAMYKKEGVLSELCGAFQFDTPGKQVFVGDKMGEKPELITQNLLLEGGFFYMCGPAVATPSVQKALKEAVAGKGGFGASKAAQWFDKFMEDGRYSEESY